MGEVIEMSEYHDYKEMYLTMVRAAEDAINILIEAQRKCEQLYLDAAEPDIRLLHPEGSPPDDREQQGTAAGRTPGSPPPPGRRRTGGGRPPPRPR